MQTKTRVRSQLATPIIPEVTIPTDADLASLYAAAEAYSVAGSASFNAWYAVREIHGPDAAYADPECKALAKVEKEEGNRLQVESDRVGERFPWLSRLSAHGHASRGGGEAALRKSVRWWNIDHADQAFKEANQDIIDPLFASLNKAHLASEPIPRMPYYSREIGDIFEIVRVAHKGKRIEIRSLLDAKTRTLRQDEFSGSRRITKRDVTTAKRLHDSRLANLERFGDDVRVED